jgi:hypothetical protein
VTLPGADSTHSWSADSEFASRRGSSPGTAYNFALHSPPASYVQGLSFHTKENAVGQPVPRLVVSINRPTVPVLAITSVTCVGYVSDGYNVAPPSPTPRATRSSRCVAPARVRSRLSGWCS